MFRGENGFTNACWVQLGILLIGFLPWHYIRTAAFLAGPPFIDTYAQTWSFQLVMGAILLAGALLALTVLLVIEACLLKLYRRIAASKHRVPDFRYRRIRNVQEHVFVSSAVFPFQLFVFSVGN